MRDILGKLTQQADPNLLVGHNFADDAGVYQLDENRALVQTVDFFPPLVDDPFDFGRVAAANSLSDIYAMGAKPLTALNIAAFPEGELGQDILAAILEGGASIVSQAGAVIVGGHTIKDNELKYGLAVTGLIDPGKIVRNSGAKPGDKLVLTKPIGSGILTTAIRATKLAEKEEKRLVGYMVQLNRYASEKMIEMGANACTDITGFGFLGHALELALASNVSIRIDVESVPLMDQALKYAGMGMITGGGQTNKLFVGDRLSVEAPIGESLEHVLFDPQTSGGLLISIPEGWARELYDKLALHYPNVSIIGEVLPRQKATIILA